LFWFYLKNAKLWNSIVLIKRKVESLNK